MAKNRTCLHDTYDHAAQSCNTTRGLRQRGLATYRPSHPYAPCTAVRQQQYYSGTYSAPPTDQPIRPLRIPEQQHVRKPERTALFHIICTSVRVFSHFHAFLLFPLDLFAISAVGHASCPPVHHGSSLGLGKTSWRVL